MAHAQLPVLRRGFGETMRKDWWWVQPAVVFLLLSAFICYATWAAFQGEYYTYGPYLSPFYSPELFGNSPHAWFGPKPGWWPGWLVFSPALLILPSPGSSGSPATTIGERTTRRSGPIHPRARWASRERRTAARQPSPSSYRTSIATSFTSHCFSSWCFCLTSTRHSGLPTQRLGRSRSGSGSGLWCSLSM